VSGEGLPHPREKDLALLRSGERRQSLAVIKTFCAFGALLAISLLALFAIHQHRSVESNPATLEAQLASLRAPWAEELAEAHRSYRIWFANHGTRTESLLFDDVSVVLLQSVLSIASSESEEGDISFLSSLYIAFHSGFIRVTFLILASFRIWLLVILAAVLYGARAFRSYAGEDILGQTGNGRMFYSGIRVGLDQLSVEGAPDIQLRGLACPEYSSISETRVSPLWHLLNEYEAVNGTNEALVAILVKNKTIRSYVALVDEEVMLSSVFSGSDLEDNCVQLLSAALSLHGIYAAGDVRSAPRGVAGSPLAQLGESAGANLSSEQYAELIKSTMHRVLPTEGRALLGSLPATEIATAILAFECGKVLAHAFEGGKWVRKSNFPNLSARAVLHSVKEYPEEYDYASRSRIRRALIYASRRSSFAAVRMPIDLNEDVWAVRQWLEILTACPHELPALSDEVELAGLVRAAHNHWLQEFLDGSVAFTPEISQQSYSTPSNLLFVPLPRVVSLLKKTLEEKEVLRMGELVDLVSSRHRLARLEAQNLDQASGDAPVVERVCSPLTEEECIQLSKLHELSVSDLRAWSALRIVLTSYGWLARRVGDYTVPDSSVIFGVFKADGVSKEANDLGFIGRKGMVPLRGSRLEDRWGRNWASRFMLVAGATMSETVEDYEKLQRGIDDRGDDEQFDLIAPALA
jgi:hypothetical protein